MVLSHPYGLVAQLGERRVRNAEVVGSIPIRSTKLRLRLRLASHPLIQLKIINILTASKLGVPRSQRRSGTESAQSSQSFEGMYVYRLRSLYRTSESYIGVTENLTRRLAEHNRGGSFHTRKFRPWRCDLAIWLPDRTKALRLERYLKDNSGKAFAAKHF